jgi:metal binding Ada-like protein
MRNQCAQCGLGEAIYERLVLERKNKSTKMVGKVRRKERAKNSVSCVRVQIFEFESKKGSFCDSKTLMVLDNEKSIMKTAPEVAGEPKLYNDDEARWQAIVQKDRAADGQFYFSVKTTGVYCRPSCPSRLANRENVEFHESPEAAERRGFRACKRCKPKERYAKSRWARRRVIPRLPDVLVAQKRFER